jgi:hypothetical protein
LEARLFLFLNFKRTPSQQEHKTTFSGLKIIVMALSDKIEFQTFLRLGQMTCRNFINSGIRQSATAFAS